MGAALAVNLVDATTISNVVSEVVVENLQSCSFTGTFNQIFEVDGNNNVISNVLQTQSNQIKFGCVGSIDNQVNIKNAIANKISTAAAAKQDTVIGLALTENINFTTTINNSVSRAFTSNIQKCSVNSGDLQAVLINGGYNQVAGIVQNQNTQIIMNCMFKNKNVVALATQINNDITAQATSSQSSIGAVIIIVMIVIAIIAGIVLFIIIKNQNFRKTFEDQQRRQLEANSRSNIGAITPSVNTAARSISAKTSP